MTYNWFMIQVRVIDNTINSTLLTVSVPNMSGALLYVMASLTLREKNSIIYQWRGGGYYTIISHWGGHKMLPSFDGGVTKFI